MKKIFFLLSLVAFPAMVMALAVEDENTYCTMEYSPICAKIQIECTTPGPCDPIQKTFGNECELGKNPNATKFYDGECKNEGGPAIPLNCTSWFDGCNTCVAENGKLIACTEMWCENPSEPECRAYEDKEDKNDSGIPLNCTSWFDGCNTCGVENGELTMCTMMWCENPTEPECRAYGDSPKACTREYVPVCGQPPMPVCPEGLSCAQVMPELKTYGNKCVLESEGAEFLYEGECEGSSGEGIEGFEIGSSGEPESFPDVQGDTKFATSINYIKEKGYVQGFGDGTFRPDHEISRYELAKIIISARYSEEEISACDLEKDLTFSDVPKNEWFSPFVCLAQKEGIINGYADGNFGGINRVTATEALKIIMGAYKVDLTPYKTKGDWYEKYQKAGKEMGLTTNISDAPNFFINRSEMAEFIFQIEQK